MNRLLSNPVLHGLTLQYEIKQPFRILSETAVSSKWWTRQASATSFSRIKLALCVASPHSLSQTSCLSLLVEISTVDSSAAAHSLLLLLNTTQI